ncbi:MAG: DUF4265 domain-containing protein [Nitrospirae bacterium]|nr:DUF4265 domain-containing protein [Candidatus Manganitrophaceae bacterium]
MTILHSHDLSGNDKQKLIKIWFALEKGVEKSPATETMWAKEVSKGQYCILNSPFYVYGVSKDDVVFGEYVGDIISFSGVAARGGHSTYRIFLAGNLNKSKFNEYWEPIEGLGCTYEGATSRLLAIDVPPAADVYKVYNLLEKGQADGIWNFEEGFCGHPLSK